MLEKTNKLLKSNPNEVPLITKIEGSRQQGLLIIGDHAGNYIPPELNNLGLPAEQLARHIAYDIGIAGVAKYVHERLDVPVVLANFSRLLIDPNRGEDDPTLLMKISDRAAIPGNARLKREEREQRLNSYYRPYHQAITDEINQFIDEDKPPLILSLHSFTHDWRGIVRPWHAGILWDKDPRFAIPLIEELAKDHALIIGDNEPYTGRLRNDCMYRHGTARGIAHALLEIRQDLIREAQGQMVWADKVVHVLSEMFENQEWVAECRQIRHFGSHSDEYS